MNALTLSGGDKLEAYLKRLTAKVSAPASLEVGFLSGSTYPDGTSVAMVAAVQEFGSSRMTVDENGKPLSVQHVPPRPFFRNMIAKHKGEWGPQLGDLLKSEDYNAPRALGTMGQVIKEELQQSIEDTNSPALAPATVKRKGFDKPLIDTSVMLNSIDWRTKP